MRGAVAQLGARVNGIHEVTGSIPVSSTKSNQQLTRMRRNGLRPSATTQATKAERLAVPSPPHPPVAIDDQPSHDPVRRRGAHQLVAEFHAVARGLARQ